MVKSKNRLFIITGPSGSGKTTIARSVMTNEIISFTTRSPRKGEIDGVDYIYITNEKFNELYDSGGLAEHTDYYGTAKYGITMEELKGKLSKGDAFVVVDVIGKEALEEIYDNTLSIFIFSPDSDVAFKRMSDRGDNEEQISRRLASYEEEIENFPLYDVLLDNIGNLGRAVEGFRKIVGGEFDSRIKK